MKKTEIPSQSGRAVLMAFGDIHLGTRCSGLPDGLSEFGVPVERLTPAAAFDAAVTFAIQQRVDAVLFAGDVVESANARIEALVPLERGIRRLADKGIPIVAVAGNHDVEALPRLASLIDGFTLLGDGGEWESRIVEAGGRAVAEIVGWSFGGPVVRESPVARLLAAPLDRHPENLPRIGLMHADLDASDSRYAPAKTREMEQAGLDAWLLGHIHKPSLEMGRAGPEGRAIGYLGSLVGLDPSETGPHGPWLITVEGAGRVAVEHRPIAPLRWEHLVVTIDEADETEDVPERILADAAGLVRDLVARDEAPEALGLRVRIEGVSRHFAAIRGAIAGGTWSSLARVVDRTAVFVNAITEGLAPPIDLADLAKNSDPPALLARRILSLQCNDESARALLDQARQELQGFADDPAWTPLRDMRDATDPMCDDALRAVLLRAAMASLNALLGQKDETTGRNGS